MPDAEAKKPVTLGREELYAQVDLIVSRLGTTSDALKVTPR